MKSFCIIALAMVAACTAEGYTSDVGIDVNAKLGSEDQVKEIIGCFKDTTPCPPALAPLKADFSDIVQTACAKCTDQQKSNVAQFFTAAQKYAPNDLEGLQKKYDPDNTLIPALVKATAGH